MLEKVKSSLGVTTSYFDEEIAANIEAALADMGHTSDIDYLEVNDPLISKAIITYCGYMHNLMHGNAELSERLKKAYDEQKKALLMSSRYSFGGGC